MYVRDVMTPNVITIPVNTTIINAKRIMREHKFRRLPVLDKEKLVGIVTDERLEKVAPPKGTPASIWEFSYSIMSKYGAQVREVMSKRLVTVSPDMTVEAAVSLAQSKKVGALVVVEKGKVVGICTTNDFFYRIVNKVLGLGEPGSRVHITGGGEGKELEKVVSLVNKHGLKIINLHIYESEGATKKDVVVHVDSEKVDDIIAELKDKGFEAVLRKR
ncbi:CBS domain-containing protein [Chloroflexota bacterium]